MIDPFGIPQFVYPLLYAYISDHPEGCKVTSTYDTNVCKLPCSLCECPKDYLSNVDTTFEARTEQNMKEIYTMMQGSSKHQSDSILKRWSLHAVKCSLWGFNGGETTMGNPYKALHVDILHQSDLGIFKMLIGIIRDIATESPHIRILQELDKRLMQLKAGACFAHFRIPGNEKGGYFCSQANFAAFEHRSIMQVIIFCMVGLYEDNIIQAMVYFLEWYVCACRSPSHTMRSLQTMEDLMTRAVLAFKSTLVEWQKSSFNTIKIHAMSHFASSIRRSGLPWEYSTNMFEQMHIALMKRAYRASNRREANAQIVKHNRRLEALRIAKQEVESAENSKADKKSTIHKAIEMGMNVIGGVAFNIHRAWLRRDITSLYCTPSSSIHDMRRRRYSVAVVPTAVRNLVKAQLEVREHLYEALHAYEVAQDVCIGEVFGVVKAVAIPPGPRFDYGDWAMYARATYDFHGGPWFSKVALQMEDLEHSPYTCYAKVRLFLHCSNCQQKTADGYTKMTLNLAFVRPYYVLDSDILSAIIQCTQISWSLPQNLDTTGTTRRQI